MSLKHGYIDHVYIDILWREIFIFVWYVYFNFDLLRCQILVLVYLQFMGISVIFHVTANMKLHTT